MTAVRAFRARMAMGAALAAAALLGALALAVEQRVAGQHEQQQRAMLQALAGALAQSLSAGQAEQPGAEWVGRLAAGMLTPEVAAQGVEIFVLDRSRAVVHGAGAAPATDVMAAAWPVAGRLDNDGRAYLTASVPVRSPVAAGHPDWIVVVRQPMAVVLAGAAVARNTVLWTAVLAALALAALAWTALARLGRPLRALAEQLASLEQGDMPQRARGEERLPELRLASETLQQAARARLDAQAALQQRLAQQEDQLALQVRELNQHRDEQARQAAALAQRTAELTQALSRIEELTILDPLTGLSNRRRAEELLHAEIQRHRRTGASCSLILASIDRFQHLTDTLGPAEGDEVVKAMAARLANACRCTDYVSRFGPDEFVLVLPETGPEGAAVVARKLLLAASATPCRAAGTVTLSLGVLVKVETVSAGDALSSARQALHLARQRPAVNVAEHGDPLTGLLHA